VAPASSLDVVLEPDRAVGIGGRLFDGYVRCEYLEGEYFATWRVPKGYTFFEVCFGLDDEAGKHAKPVTFTICLDGDVVKSVKLSPGEKAVCLSVPVKAGGSLRLAAADRGVFAEPRLLAKPAGGTTLEPGGTTTAVGMLEAQASFVVDPRDLDKLADSLRKKVDAAPSLKERVQRGQVALATFKLIDISSSSVAQNVAEDLYTAMINAQFSLVERGQLDRILAEIKVTDIGLIDPKTAQKIGQLTGCDVILLGSISDRGQFVVVNARMMETATGKSLVAERVEMRKIPIQRGS